MAAEQGSSYFEVGDESDVTVLDMIGPEIRHPGPAAEMAAEALRLIEQEATTKMLVNLSKVEYMSSTGFATLINLAKKAKELGCDVRLCAIHPDAQVGANIIGLARLVPTYASEEEGLASFGVL